MCYNIDSSKEQQQTNEQTERNLIMKLYGFYCRMYGKDCFVETTQVKKTKVLAESFANKVQNKLNRFYNVGENDIVYIQKAMRRATFEIKTIQNGNFAGLKYYEINGTDFSYGCDACENPLEECVLVI